MHLGGVSAGVSAERLLYPFTRLQRPLQNGRCDARSGSRYFDAPRGQLPLLPRATSCLAWRCCSLPSLPCSALSLTRLAKALLTERYEIRARDNQNSEGTVLVLGGAGYIGSSLVRKLLESGRKVRVVDSLVYGDEPLRGVFGHPNLEMRIGDCRNIQDMVAAVRGVDSIIDLAAIVGDPACEQDKQTALEINYAATRMLIEVAKGHGIQRFIFASSCSVYGATDVMMDENSAVASHLALRPDQAGFRARPASKHASETFHPTILRLATVFGLSYRPRFDLVVNLLMAKAYQRGRNHHLQW